MSITKIPALWTKGLRPPEDAATHLGTRDQARAVVMKDLVETFGVQGLIDKLDNDENVAIVEEAVDTEESRAGYYV